MIVTVKSFFYKFSTERVKVLKYRMNLDSQVYSSVGIQVPRRIVRCDSIFVNMSDKTGSPPPEICKDPLLHLARKYMDKDHYAYRYEDGLEENILETIILRLNIRDRDHL